MQIIDCEQGTQKWADARRGRATASRFTDILTAKKCEFSKAGSYTYICELLAERYVPPHYWIGNDYESGPMMNGNRTEREARNYFEFITGEETETIGFVTTDDGFFGASPDFFQGDDAGGELKCPTHAKQIKYLLDPELLRTEYRAQCVGGMIVCERPKWTLMSYAVGLAPVVINFVVDDYTQKLAEALESFRAMYHELAAKIEGSGDPVAATRTLEPSYF